MPLTIICPISGKPIEFAVVVGGYIYDRKTVQQLKLIDQGRLAISKDTLITDHFTDALISYESTYGTTTIKFDDLDKLYTCPVSKGFPQVAVFCLVDGRIYDKEFFEKSYAKKEVSPLNNKPVNNNDLIYHPFHSKLMAAFKGSTEIDLQVVFQDSQQPYPTYFDFNPTAIRIIDTTALIIASLSASFFAVIPFLETLKAVKEYELNKKNTS